MENLFLNLFEIFVFFLLGYFSVKFKLFPENYSKAYTDFIINIGFPGLVFYNIYNLSFNFDVIFIVFLGYVTIFLSLLMSFFIGKAFSFERKTLASFMMLSSFGNTGFLGYPFVVSIQGEEALKYAVIFDQLAMFLPIYILAPIIVSYGLGETNFSIDIKKILLFPPFIALIAAALAKSVSIPHIFLDVSQALGKTVIPLIMFSVGMNIKISSLWARFRDIVAVLVIKNLLIPILILLMLIVLGYNLTLPIKVAILQISMPPMVLASIFIINAGLDKELAVLSVATGIIFSFITVPFIYYLVQFCAKL